MSGNFGGAVYKSADGTTWTKEDSNVWFGQLPDAAYWDGSSSTITILLCDIVVHDSASFGNMSGQVIEFHMDTGTYGAPTPSVELVGSSPGNDQYLVGTRVFKLSNGTYRVLYNAQNHHMENHLSDSPPSFQETVTDTGIYYVDYVGGAWTSPVIIAGGAGNWYAPFYAVQDGDATHVIYGVQEYPDGGALSTGSNLAVQQTGFRYVQIAADGSLSTPQTIDALPGTGTNAAPIWVLQTGIISGDNIIIPAAKWEYPFGGRHTKMGVLIGSPKANPTFTWAQFSMAPVPDDAGDPYDMKMIRLGSTDYLGWLHFKQTDPGVGQIYVVTSSDHGSSWTPPQLVLDVIAWPPPPADGDTQYVYSISLGAALDGTSLGLMYTSWATYWTNAPALLT